MRAGKKKRYPEKSSFQRQALHPIFNINMTNNQADRQTDRQEKKEKRKKPLT
jgi:hypothetical protein